MEEKRDENTINDFAENLQMISNTNRVTKEEFLQKIDAKNIIKNKMITVAGQINIENGREIDNSNQRIIGVI